MVINAGLAAVEGSGGIDLQAIGNWEQDVVIINGTEVCMYRVVTVMGEKRSRLKAAAHDVLADKPGRSGFMPEVSSGSKALYITDDTG